jgi:hypothetical protein
LGLRVALGSCHRKVRIETGAIQLTLMPCSAQSSASERVRPTIPAFSLRELRLGKPVSAYRSDASEGCRAEARRAKAGRLQVVVPAPVTAAVRPASEISVIMSGAPRSCFAAS